MIKGKIENGTKEQKGGFLSLLTNLSTGKWYIRVEGTIRAGQNF